MSEPIEWKSRKWWANRPLDDRIMFLRAPERIVEEADRRHSYDDWHAGTNILIVSATSNRNIAAYDLVLQALTENKVSARWVDADRYIEMVKDSFEDGGLGDEYDSPWVLKNIQGVHDIVVLANLGDERDTEFARHELQRLICTRWDKKMPVIITSRLTPTELSARYGPRVGEALGTYEIEPAV